MANNTEQIIPFANRKDHSHKNGLTINYAGFIALILIMTKNRPYPTASSYIHLRRYQEWKKLKLRGRRICSTAFKKF